MKALIEKFRGFHIQIEAFKGKWTAQIPKKSRAAWIRGMLAAISSVPFV
jgi:hypothetical protein